MERLSIDRCSLHKLVNVTVLIVAVLSPLVIAAEAVENGLKVGYYRDTCPEAEGTVSAGVAKAVRATPGVVAGLIRMHFRDCFVRVSISTLTHSNQWYFL